ncbi:MAG TPA: HEAT repeat domain-containing protein [Longimicrobiales bacterium]|nr:HEAT repeat domain-containing protein [Longimicrobiales bacterium]
MAMSSGWLPILAESALKGTVLLALAGLAAFWLKRGSAASRHMAWQVGLVGVLALPVMVKLNAVNPVRLDILPISFGSRVAQAVRPAENPASASLVDVETPQAESAGPQSMESGTPSTMPSASVSVSPRWRDRLLGSLGIIWILGVIAVLGRFLVGLLVAQWYTRRAKPLDAIEWASLNETMSFAVGLGHPVRLLRSDRASTPMTFGVLDPVVLLPKDADAWPEERRRIVLLHELAHVHRLDSLTHVFAQLACAIYWFNPLVWISATRLRAEAERACDDWVLRAGMRASTYADHLLDMVRTIGRLHTPAIALPMAQRSTFEGRLLAILEPGLNRNGLTRGQAVLLTGIIAVIVFPLAALSPAPARAGGPAEDLPTSSALVQDTTQQKSTLKEPDTADTMQGPTRPRGWLSGITRSALDAVNDAFKRGDVEAAVHNAVDDLDLEQVAKDAIDGAFSGKRGQQLSDTVLNALLGALKDNDAEVRASAVQTLAQQEDPRAVAALSRALREEQIADVRRSIAWALGQIEDARAVPALSEALRADRDVEVRRQAAWALGQIESASAIDALTAAMKDADADVRHQAVWALGQIEDARAVPALTQAIRDENVETRRQAAWALGQIEDVAAVPALTVALRDADAQVRHQAVWALGQIEEPEAVAPLATMLTDANAGVRKQVAWALGQIESNRAVEPLSRLLREDQDAGVREQAAWALGQIEDAAAIPAVAAALKDASPAVRRQAAWALGQIERSPAPQQLLEALRDQDVEVKRQAVWALGQIEDANAAAALREALKDTDAYVKRGALRALAAIGDEAAYTALADMLKDPDPNVRKMAAQALGRGGMHWPEPQPRPQPQPQPRPQPRPRGW